MKKLLFSFIVLFFSSLIVMGQVPSPYTPTITVVTITTTSSQVLPANTTRRGLILQNVGAYDITCSFGSTSVTAGNGIVLGANTAATKGLEGASASFVQPSVNSALQCISITGTSYLTVIEGN